MKKKTYKPQFAKKKGASGQKKLIVALSCAAVLLLVFVIALICMIPGQEPEETVPVETTAAPTEPPVTEVETTAEPTTIPPETEPEILEEYAELYEKNPDFAGWIRIPGTVIDYPVLYSPDDGEKYLYANFDGYWDVHGSIFIKDSCSMDPESDNLLIYGHNMINGSMFGSILNYGYQHYWEEHPIIEFSTLYEHRQYEIIAAFNDRVYYKTEDCFKFYQFIDAEDEEHFQEAMDYFKEHSLIDTGVTAEYGDRLITLITCAYHVKNGRFVVVAREIPAE